MPKQNTKKGRGKRRGKPFPAGHKPSNGFKKGKSGNPGGRPKESGEVKELARQWTVDALKKIHYLMDHAGKDSTQLAAAEAILDRGWGRPAQAIEGGDTNKPLVLKVVYE